MAAVQPPPPQRQGGDQQQQQRDENLTEKPETDCAIDSDSTDDDIARIEHHRVRRRFHRDAHTSPPSDDNDNERVRHVRRKPKSKGNLNLKPKTGTRRARKIRRGRDSKGER